MKFKERKNKVSKFILNPEVFLNEFYLGGNSNSKEFILLSLKRSNPLILRRKSHDIIVGDIDIFDEVLVNDCYKIQELNFDYGINVLDIGANIGIFSWMVLSLFQINNLLCIEPDSELFKRLLINIKSEKFEKIGYYNGACGIRTGDKYYKNSWNIGGGTFLHSSVNSKKVGQRKRSIDLKTLCRNNKINHFDLVKVDTEGSELHILNDLLSCNVQILNIFLEVHNEDQESEIINTLYKFGHTSIKVLSQKSSTEGNFKIFHSKL